MTSNKLSLRGFFIWFICAIFFMYEFLLRTVLGTFQFPIMSDLHLSPVKFALLSSTAYQLIYGFMQLPVGIITDKFGLKKALLFAVVFCGLANIGFACTHQFSIAVMFRIIMGLGSAFGFICLLVAVYEWMPRKNIALFIGLSQFIGTMGPMSAAGPLNMLAEAHAIGWRGFFISLAAAAAVIGILVLFFVDNKRDTTGKFLILSRAPSIKHNLRCMLSSKQIWLIALFSAGIYFSIEYLSENEGVSFLIAKGFSSTFSSYMITLVWLGYALGSPSLGFISDKIQRRKPVMIAAAVLLIFALICIIYLPLSRTLMALFFFLLGIGVSGQIVGFAVIAENCKENYLAVGLAFNNAMMMLVAGINAPFMEYILSKASHSDKIQLHDYQQTFVFMIGLGLFSFIICAFFIKETFCKSMMENTLLNLES